MSPRRPAFLGHRWSRLLRSIPRSAVRNALFASVAAFVGVSAYDATLVPIAALLFLLAAAVLVLRPRELPWFVGASEIAAVVWFTLQPVNARTVASLILLLLSGISAVALTRWRVRTGVSGVEGEAMLNDLRHRIQSQGRIPELPHEWVVSSEVRSASGTPFSGDFVVTHRGPDRLDLVLVDVSGKGEKAGTRALLLSGALGGLLGSLRPEDFLREANAFLVRQNWEEGFATAIHLSLDLGCGSFKIWNAGHPPAAQLHAGSGRWELLESEGPLLGILDDVEFAAVSGVLRDGDAMLLCTDGMIERRTRDLNLGIDRMLGQAERVLRGDYTSGISTLMEALGDADDDRALLLIHRRAA